MMTGYPRPRSRDQFTVAIICALPHETEAVEAVFDELYDDDTDDALAPHPKDKNTYTAGRVREHYVVLVYMSSMGKLNAANVSGNIALSYRNIRLALVVGVCGGVPRTTQGNDIFLGDVIISTRLVLYDEYMSSHAETIQPALFNPGNRIKSSRQVQAFLAKLHGERGHGRLVSNLVSNLARVQDVLGLDLFSYPGVERDRLFPPSYPHRHLNDSDCSLCRGNSGEKGQICHKALGAVCEELGCSKDATILQRTRAGLVDDPDCIPPPTVHMGPIASGDSVIMCGSRRDEMNAKHGILGFEMEAAGVCAYFLCVVIKGVSDYADCHKSKKWQHYAAASAASCMKAFLHEYPVQAQDALVDATRVTTNPAVQSLMASLPLGQIGRLFIYILGFLLARYLTKHLPWVERDVNLL